MNTHRIHRVSKLTSLSKDVIRVWERRYGIIQPQRGENGYRIYTDEDVALLRYLRKEMDQGISIGDLSALGREALISKMHAQPEAEAYSPPAFDSLIDELTASLDPFDIITFERRLSGSVAVIPFEEALHGILIPLQIRIGQLWHDGKIGIAVEHYVTQQVQQKIFTAMNQFRISEKGYKIVIACAPEEEHEVGAQMSAYFCRLHGHQVHYLGSNVPADSLRALCAQVQPDLTLLSMTLTPSKETLEKVIQICSEHILALCPIWVGGEGAQAVSEQLQKNGMLVLNDHKEFQERLFKFSKKNGPEKRKN